MKPLMEQMHQNHEAMKTLEASGPFDETRRAPGHAELADMIEMEVAHARIRSEIVQILTPDQKTKLAQLEASHESDMGKHGASTGRSSRELSLSSNRLSPYRARNRSTTSPGFFRLPTGETNGTRRPALLGLMSPLACCRSGPLAAHGRVFYFCSKACPIAAKLRTTAATFIYENRAQMDRESALMVPKKLRPSFRM